jgi:hypothetical protein
MKKLMIFALIILSASSAFGQGRHSIKVGVGANLMWDIDSGYNLDKNRGTIYSPGPTLHIDYGYKLNNYLELGVNAFSLTNHYGENADAMRLGALANAVFTPLPKTFRYIRIGIGIGWMNFQRIETAPNTRSERRNVFAGDYYIRAYAIDNSRFELYGSYGLTHQYNPQANKLFWSHSNISLHFGVKF